VLSAATQAFEIERGAKQELHGCKVEEEDASGDTPGYDTTSFTTSFTTGFTTARWRKRIPSATRQVNQYIAEGLKHE